MDLPRGGELHEVIDVRVVAEARAKVATGVELSTGYELLWGREFENQERAMKRLTLVLPLSSLLTFLLLFSAFGSVWDAAIILFNMANGVAGRPARAVADGRIGAT